MSTKKPPLLGMIFLVLFSVTSIHGENPQLVWVEVDTTVKFTLNIPPAEARNQTLALARLEAIRRAVPEEVLDVSLFRDIQNQIGKQLEEVTTHSIFALSTRQGMIVKEQILKEQPSFRNNLLCYRLQLKAGVQIVQGQRDPSLELQFAVKNKILREGDKLEIEAQSNRDGYLYVFNFLSDNSVLLLFPNQITKDNFIKANQKFTLPTAAEKAQGITYKVVANKDKKVTDENIYAVFCLQKVAGWEKLPQVQVGRPTWTAGDDSFSQFQRWLLAVPLHLRLEKAEPIQIINK